MMLLLLFRWACLSGIIGYICLIFVGMNTRTNTPYVSLHSSTLGYPLGGGSFTISEILA